MMSETPIHGADQVHVNDHCPTDATTVHPRSHSGNSHFPSQIHSGNDAKETSETGWKGAIPSHDGGDTEEDFLHKPPYEWKSHGDSFKPKYRSYVFSLCR